MYFAANNSIIASFDGQSPILFGGISASGVLAKAYLGYNPTRRSLTTRGANATFSSTAHNFSTVTLLPIGHLKARMVPLYGWIRSILYYPTPLTDS